jgi:hypothetical protein
MSDKEASTFRLDVPGDSHVHLDLKKACEAG